MLIFKKQQPLTFLVVGLGNPKDKYKETRHNIGFKVIDKISSNFQFTEFKFQLNFNAQISINKINDVKVILAKPLTFMNLSGKSVARIARYYKIDLQNIIVIHDDVDIPLNKIKIVINKGAGGHKGVESIIKELKSKNFIRIRMGICPEKKLQNTRNFVLDKFSLQEKDLINQSLIKASQAVETIIKQGLLKSASLFNK